MARIAALLATGSHVLVRVKSDIRLPPLVSDAEVDFGRPASAL